MRIILRSLIALLLLATNVYAQTSDGVEGSCVFSNTTNCTVNLTGVTAGSAIIVTSATDGSHTTLTASDGTNTYANALVTGSGPSVGSIVACNVASGNPSITVTISAARFGGARAKEVKGAATSSCLEARASNTQTSVGTGTDAITSGVIGTPASSGAYVYGVTSKGCCTATTITAGTGFTSDLNINDSGATSLSEYLIQGSPTSATATFTASVAGSNYQTHGIIIKAAGGGGGGAPRNLMTTGVGQ